MLDADTLLVIVLAVILILIFPDFVMFSMRFFAKAILVILILIAACLPLKKILR